LVDRLQRLRYVDVPSKAVTVVDQDKWGEITNYKWSPDSQWIAWERPRRTTCRRCFLFSLADKKAVAVTDDWYASGDPVFSDDGKYLLLVSSRDFKPTFGQNDVANIYRDMSRVYLVTLCERDAFAARPAQR
jgi:tricorn protease